MDPFKDLRSTKGLLTLVDEEGLQRSSIKIKQIGLGDQRYGT
jgi:hypothetical protein